MFLAMCFAIPSTKNPTVILLLSLVKSCPTTQLSGHTRKNWLSPNLHSSPWLTDVELAVATGSDVLWVCRNVMFTTHQIDGLIPPIDGMLGDCLLLLL